VRPAGHVPAAAQLLNTVRVQEHGRPSARWMAGPLQTRCTCAHFPASSAVDIQAQPPCRWPSQPCWPAAWLRQRTPSRVRPRRRLRRSHRPTTNSEGNQKSDGRAEIEIYTLSNTAHFSPSRPTQFSPGCENNSRRVPKAGAKEQRAAFAPPLVLAEPSCGRRLRPLGPIPPIACVMLHSPFAATARRCAA
jgi:hypothetical protein